MSRGPGRIERIVEQAFRADARRIWTVPELCGLVWPGHGCSFARKQRVSVLRAAHRVAERTGFQSWTPGLIRPVIVFAGPLASSCDVREALVRENDELERRISVALGFSKSQSNT
ncbi:hypothetical protein Q2941_32500 [Bradyrhizobium sp. UFLA05-153]